jgi:UDP-N-acetylmuramate dehydrogenase
MMQLLQNEPLSKYCTFGIGGAARYFTTVYNVHDVKEALFFAKEKGIPFLTLGKGSNCLFDDRGYNGLIILNKITYLDFEREKVSVGSGYSFAHLGIKTSKKKLSGLEFASGIPASVGGAIYMNAGANKMETKDTLLEVFYVDDEGQERLFRKEELNFDYRFSSFQEMRGIIIGASFSLTKKESAKEKQKEILTHRLATQPYKAKTCGCVFQNPDSAISAGKLIDDCGLKGYAVGGALISLMHANFIENQGSASAADVQKILKEVKEIVKEKTGYDLQLEVCVVPYEL